MSAITIPMAPNTATNEEISQIFEAQRAYAAEAGQSTAKERKAKIKLIHTYTMDHLDDIMEAMHKDFRKPPAEVILGEILSVVSDAKHNMRNLRKWMKPKRVPMPLTLVGTSSHIRRDSKGNVLVLSPWNYPYNLAIGPLISSLAAGNVTIVKPSEMTPHTSALMHKMIDELFDRKEVALIEGNVQVAQHLLSLPFNHIHFTGSPQVGKIVMKAAAEHLASVTLELGGKSPTIVDETASIKTVAERVAWGKCLNNGQTCIAPDYLLVQNSAKDKFISAFKNSVDAMYNGIDQVGQSDSYARIVNRRHFDRIKGILEDAVEKGAKVELGGEWREEDNFIAPTLLTNVSSDMRIMQEEIFGPLMPMMTYDKKEDALAKIQEHEAPLVLYVNSKNKKNIDYFLDNVPSGDAVVNETLVHFAHPGLPFGGKNNSGIGKASGHAGFCDMTHERSVMVQKFGTLKPFYPPYNDSVLKILKTVLKIT